MLSAFRCHVLDAFSPIDAQLLGFALLQLFGAYPWQEYAHPGDGYLPMPGVHQVTAFSTAPSRGSFCYLSAVLQLFQQYGEAYSSGGFAESPNPSAFPARHSGALFQVRYHPMTWSTLNLWWAFDLVILVW